MLQKIIDVLYRHPLAKLRLYKKFGGYLAYRQMLQGQKLMQKAAIKLPPFYAEPGGLPVYFLTGKKYLYQTLFCLYSLKTHTSQPFNITLIDDGTFNEELVKQIKKQIPGASIITQQIINSYLDKSLPKTEFPALRAKREKYIHLRKLTDVHVLPGPSWKLVLDSDMLFWNNPGKIIAWLKKPDRPLHLVDCNESYGYSRSLMEQLAGTHIPALLNVGAIGLKSDAIDWDKMEHWLTALEDKEGATYYLEQALSAMLIGDQPCSVPDAGEYIINPGAEITASGTGTLHHYVDLSKKEYYTYAWRKFING